MSNSTLKILPARKPANHPMKTNPSFKISKLRTLALLAIAIAAALMTQPVCADDIVNTIVITENSSTSLTATYNGSTSGVTVNNFAPDGWGLKFSSSVSFPVTTFVADWVEPENSGEVNAFTTALNFAELDSDVPPFGNPTVPNGTTVDNVGTDTSNGGTINVTFFDKGDVATVPETGSTFGLLFVSVIALFGLNRLRCVHLA